MLILKADKASFHKIFQKAGSANEPVIFPTDTIYGIGARLSDIAANKKIFEAKGRDASKAFPVLAGSAEQAEEIAHISPAALKLLTSELPAPCTMILKAKDSLNSLFTQNGTVAIRIPKTEPLRSFLSEFGAVTATSANPAGEAYCNDTEKIISSFAELIRYFLISDKLTSEPSAIADFSGDNPQIIRSSGAISLDFILSYANLGKSKK
jgi:L-threonylcarbamoyladenylate synthase